ncbi:hypothetical protein [Pseudomonas syringae]|uniref:hypothetical protein n=1 Tax=Pseudomonas syringae TaxID=317 RepID=UPI0003FD6271|nr:hypothetical protein [Pseudomonas syringae]
MSQVNIPITTSAHDFYVNHEDQVQKQKGRTLFAQDSARFLSLPGQTGQRIRLTLTAETLAD